MTYEFVGTHPESLASGRPLVFGDQVADNALTDADAHLKPLLVEVPSPAAPAPTPAPAASDPSETPDPKAS